MSSPTLSLAARATAFKALHRPLHPLVLANVFDATSAALVAALPQTAALATASYAMALALGTTDPELTLDAHLAALQPIAAVARRTGKLLTVDLQSGYGDRLADAVRAVMREPIGASGINLEDSEQATGAILGEDEAVARIETALRVAREEGVPDFVVNARSDSFVRGGTLEEAVRRGRRYLAAGATTAYVFWQAGKPMDEESVAFAVRELGGMVNLAPRLGAGGKGLTTNDLKRLGVARVSVGPQIYLAAAAALKKAAEETYGLE